MKIAYIFCILGLALSASAHGTEAVSNAVYKWTDAKGVVHYGDRPAAVADMPRNETAIGKRDLAAGDNPAAIKSLAGDVRASAEKKRIAVDAAKVAKEMAAESEGRAKACQSAREAQRVYASGGRITTIDTQGEKVYLTPEDIQARQAEANKAAEEACAPPKPAPAPAASSGAPTAPVVPNK